MQQLIALYTSFTGEAPKSVETITGSGSNRQYIRFTSAEGRSLIGVVGTSLEENRAFCHLSDHFTHKHLPVPRVLAVSEDGLRYLQEDLGARSLFDAIRGGREAGGNYSEDEKLLLRKTIALLPALQILGAEDLDFSPCYPQEEMDQTSVFFDLNYFKYCFLKPTGLDFHELRLEEDFRRLAQDLTSDRQMAFLYRDFQARNVMLDANNAPHFIDFQGGRRGPVQYDLASFLWQASARYSPALREELTEVYLDNLRRFRAVDEGVFRSRLQLFVLFRLLQVLGAYGFRGYFERKKHFLDSIPPALKNLRELLQKKDGCPYEYLREVLEKMTKKVMETLPEEEAEGLRQEASGLRQEANGLRQEASGLRQEASGLRQEANGLRQEANGLRQEANGLRQEASGLELEAAAASKQTVSPKATSAQKTSDASPLRVRIFSFSYKKGIPEDTSGNGGGYVFDCRSTHNPGRYEPYKKLTGLDEPVIRFLENDGEILLFLDNVYRLADKHVERYLQRGFTNLMFCFGCTGGQHRSVYSAQHLAEHLNTKYGVEVELTHREQNIHTILPAPQ